MLQEIVLAVCMMVSPYACKDVHVQVSSEHGESLQVPFHCFRQGQIEGQKWIASQPPDERGEPRWRITRWKCPPMNGRQEA